MFEIFIEAVKEISGVLLVMAAIGVWSLFP
jgi:hypothetical protein